MFNDMEALENGWQFPALFNEQQCNNILQAMMPQDDTQFF